MDLLQAAGQIATCVSAVVALVAVIVAVSAYRKQHTAQAFIHYTDRYGEIMAQFPAWARGPRQFGEDALQESTDSLRSACLNYLNLCSEEFFLHQERFLAGKVWNIWKDEITRTLQSALFRREWPFLKERVRVVPCFCSICGQCSERAKYSLSQLLVGKHRAELARMTVAARQGGRGYRRSPAVS